MTLKASWGLELSLADGSRLRVPRRQLSPQALAPLDLPPATGTTPDVAPEASLHTLDGRVLGGRVAAVDANRIVLKASDGSRPEVKAAELDPQTFQAVRELGPEEEKQAVAVTLTFDDGSTMKVKTAPGATTSAATGGKVKKVRQKGTELDLDLEDGSTFAIQTAEMSSCVMLRGKANNLEYAD